MKQKQRQMDEIKLRQDIEKEVNMESEDEKYEKFHGTMAKKMAADHKKVNNPKKVSKTYDKNVVAMALRKMK